MGFQFEAKDFPVAQLVLTRLTRPSVSSTQEYIWSYYYFFCIGPIELLFKKNAQYIG